MIPDPALAGRPVIPAAAPAGRAVTHRLACGGLQVDLGGRRVLDGVDCRIGPGWTAVVGPNGAGKSTLLRVLAGLLRPTAGTVTLDELPLAQVPRRERGRRIAWLAQAGETSGELNARETVALGRLPHLGLAGMPGPIDEAAIDRAMALTECGAWADRSLAELSGGERQRVLIARALATEADILLLDEPTSHLDPQHQVAIVRLARQLAATHTVITVLHDLPLALYADRILLLQAGRVRADAAFDAPELHLAMMDAFDGAVRIESGSAGQRPLVQPNVRPTVRLE